MRYRIFIPTIVFIAICAGWSLLWKVTADQVQTRMDGWFASEQAAGRQWACADRSFGGYPFRIEFRCSAPKLTASVSGQIVVASAGDLLAAANAYQPNLVVASVQSPLKISAAGSRTELAWKDLRISARGGLGGLSDVAIDVDHPILTATPEASSATTSTSDRLEIYARKTGDAGAPEVAVKVLHGSLARLDELTGETDPFDLVLRAAIAGEGLTEPGPLPSRLENWRVSGGQVNVEEFQFAKASARLSATGPLSLDEAHRPQGKLAIETSGVEPLLQRYGVSPAAVSIGSALSSFLPGKTPAQTLQPGTLRLPLVLANGRMAIGPVRVPVALLPLY